MQKGNMVEQVVAKAHLHQGGIRQPGEVIYVHKRAAQANITSGRAVDPKDAHKVRAIRESDYIFTLREEEEKKRSGEDAKDPSKEDPLEGLEGEELATFALESDDYRIMQAACARLDLGGKGSGEELKVKLGGYLQEADGQPRTDDDGQEEE